MSKEITQYPAFIEDAKTRAPETNLERLELTAKTIASVGIEDEDTYREAGAILVSIATVSKNWESFWKKFVSAAKASYDIAKAERDEPLKRLSKVREIYEREMDKFRKRIEAKRLEDEAKILAANAETKIRLEADLKKAIVSGRMGDAREIRDRLDIIPSDEMTLVPHDDLKLEGVAQVETVEAEVTDLKAFLKGIVDGVIPLYGPVFGSGATEHPIIEPNLPVIKQYARSMGSAFAFPGVKIERKISFRPRSEK